MDFSRSFRWCTPNIVIGKGCGVKAKKINIFRFSKFQFFQKIFFPKKMLPVALFGISG